MEQLTPKDEFLRLEADISQENARALSTLNEMIPCSLSEHVRRGTALYSFAIKKYTQGGQIHGVNESGVQEIPLFYSNHDMQHGIPVRLSLNLNKETANALNELGLDDENENTAVLDNVINYYNHAMTLSFGGNQLIVVNPDGTNNELVIALS